jgi:peptidoglycan/xylan/chitin deacetylase (PgdA/CDA1 family)
MSTDTVWPNGARCAVMLTFDFDAETLWISRDEANWKRPGTLSAGTYAGKVAIPKILDVLRHYALKATFYVPGWTAEKYRDRIEAIIRDGHEIGHHGYLHLWPNPNRPDEERAEMEKGLDSLRRLYGIKPVGYRSPAAETTELTMKLLAEHGFLYDSSLMDDIGPYRTLLEDGSFGPVELPFYWNMNDAIHTLFARAAPRSIFPNSHLYELWTDEFKGLYEWGGLVNVVMHPELIGRPARIDLLRRFIEFAMDFPGVWFATGQEVAEAWLAHNPDRPPEQYAIG